MGELLSFHQEVKRFQKERICWHSTNQCYRVYFDSHTMTRVTVSKLDLEKIFENVQVAMV